MVFNVIRLNFPQGSFSWTNGLYILIDTKGNELHLCQLDNNFEPVLFSDGRFMISITGIGNPAVCLTNLKYNYNGTKN